MKNDQVIIIQLLALSMLSLLTSFQTVGQNATMFFIPAKPTNISYFYTPTKSEEKALITTIQYAHLDTLLELTTSGDLGSPYSRKESFVIYGDEINIFQERYKGQNAFGRHVDEIKTYSSPATSSNVKTIGQIYFKMPTSGQSASWYYIDLNGGLIRCTSSYTTLIIEGIKTRCVLVIKKPMERSGKETEWAQRAEYYAKGIGLYKVELLRTKEIVMILDYQKYDTEIVEHQKEVDKQERRNKEIAEIISKTYDISTYDTAVYAVKLDQLQKKTYERLFKLSLTRLKDFPYYSYESRKFDIKFTMAGAGSYRPDYVMYCVVNSGPDDKCDLFKPLSDSNGKIDYLSIGLGPIVFKGVEARTSATFYNFIVCYHHGFIKAKKTSKGITVYLGDLPNDPLVREVLNRKLADLEKGKYDIEYEIGQIGNEKIALVKMI